KLRAAAPIAPPSSEDIPVDVESQPEITQVSSQVGTGVSLPRVTPLPKPSPRPGSWSNVPTPSGKFPASMSARVLLVDDDADIRDVVGAMLEAVGLVVEPVNSAEEALDRVREKHFDLLVLDWNLPGMTGLELCRQIRREGNLANLPVLFLTAHSSAKDIVDAF